MKRQHSEKTPPPNGRLEHIATPKDHAGTAGLAVAKARVLVAQGDLDAAEQLLCSIPPTPSSLDLMARLYGQTGRWDRARTAWENVLRIDPDNPDARNALRRLESNWLFRAVAARVAQLAALAALLTFSAAGLLYIFKVLPEPAPSPPHVTIISRGPTPIPEHPSTRPPDHDAAVQVAVRPPEEAASQQNTSKPEARPSLTVPYEEPVPAAPPLPRLSIAGAVVSTNNGQVAIVFEEGVFRYRCELSESAERSLKNVVTALLDCPPVSTLLIAGHTDNDPMPPGGPFPSNYALGFARAATVASWFRDNSAIPHDVIVTTSHGAEAPPFSNDDYDSRLRNRTVVLRVQFREQPTEDRP